MRLADQRLFVPVLTVTALVLSGAGLLLLDTAAPEGELQATQLPGLPSGAEQLEGAIEDVFASYAAPQGSAERALEERERDAFLDAIPQDAPQPLLTYTQAVQEVFTGVMLGADADAASGLTEAQLGVAEATMNGFAAAFFRELPANPSTTSSVLLADLAEGFARGAAEGAGDGHVRARSQAYRDWADAMGRHATEWATGQSGAMPPAPLGSQGLALQAWSEGAAAGALTGFPEASDAQSRAFEEFADELMAWGPGRILAEAPPSLGTPLVEAMRTWVEGFVESGFEDMPTAPGAGSVDLWEAWGRAVLGTAIERLSDMPTGPGHAGLRYLHAWASGLGASPGSLEGAGPYAERVRGDVEVYGATLTDNAMDFLLVAEGWRSERIDGVQAWAGALTTALQDMQPPITGGPDRDALEAWADQLAEAIQDIPVAPSTAGIEALRGWGEGAAGAGMDIMYRYAQDWRTEEAVALANATAEGVGDALDMIGTNPGTDGELAEGLAEGLVSAVMTNDPENVPFAAFDYVTVWVEGAGEGAIDATLEDTWRSAANGVNHAWAIGYAIGGPAVEHAHGMANITFLRERVAATNATLQEAKTWAEAVGSGLVPAVQDAVEQTDLPPLDNVDWVEPFATNVSDYLTQVLTVASGAPIGEPQVDEDAIQAFAELVLAPAGWFVGFGTQGEPSINSTYVDATTAFGTRFAEDADPSKLDREAWKQGAVAIVDGFTGGLVTHLGNATGLVPYADEQRNVTVAWAEGTAAALGNLTTPPGGFDPDLWAKWANATASGAAQAATDGAGHQADAIALFAEDTIRYVENLTADEPPGPPDTPLVAWAEAYARSWIGNISELPEPMTDEQLEAALAWAEGVREAIGQHPDPSGYPEAQRAAIEAWVEAVSGAAGEFLAAIGEPDGPDLDFSSTEEYVHNLLAHAMVLPAQFQPAQSHVDEISAWARGSAEGFAEQLGLHAGDPEDSIEAVVAWANWTAQGTTRVAQDATAPQQAILEAYAGGVMHGAGAYADYLQSRLQAGEPPDNPFDSDGFDAFAQGVIDGVFDIIDGDPLLDPEQYPERQTVQRTEAFANATVFGGTRALREMNAASRDHTAPMVRAWAEAVVAEGLDSLLLPNDMDPEAMRQYIEGVAHAGVAKVGATPDVTQAQAAMLVLWGEALANLTQDHVFRNLTGDMSGEDPTWQYYAEALVNATLALPTGPTEQQSDAWQQWAQAVLGAGGNLSTAPSQASAELMQAWVQATVDGFGARMPQPDVDDLQPPSPEEWATYTGAMDAWLRGFVGSALWDLPRYPPSPDPDEDAAWVQWLVEDASTNTCTANFPNTCAAIMRIVGEASADALADLLHDDDEGSPTGPPGGGDPGTGGSPHEGLVQAVGEALEQDPGLDPEVLAGAVSGALQAMLESPPQDADQAQGAAGAAIAAVAAQADQLQGPDPAGLAEDLAYAITQGLPPVPEAPGAPSADRFPAWAHGIADGVLADLASRGVALPSEAEARRAQVDGLVQGWLSGNGQSPASIASAIGVRVGDGTNSYEGPQLDGTPFLQGDHDQLVTVTVPPAAEVPGASWAVSYALGGFGPGTQGTQIPLTPGDGGYQGIIPDDATSGSPDGTELALVVLRILPGGAPIRFDRGGEPYSYRVDSDAPAFELTAPATAASSAFTVAWSATHQGAPIAGYWIEVKRNAGPWETLLEGTLDTSMVFTGIEGTTYQFRGHAEDEAGHESDEDTATTQVPSGAAPPGAPGDPGASNLAPSIALTDPLTGARRGTITVRFAASDPNGPRPAVRVELLPTAGSAHPVWSGIPDGAGHSIPLDTTAFPDGTYRVRAVANDGALTAEAVSGAFVIDNTAPALDGPKPAGGPAGGVLLLVQAADVELVQVKLAPSDAPSRAQQYLMRDDGTRGDATAGDGYYSVAVYGLPEGEYLATVSATDQAGNSLERTLTMHIANTPRGGLAPPDAPPVSGGSGPGSSGAPAPPPAPRGLFGLPGFEVPFAAAALAAVGLALRRRRRA